MGAGGIRVGRGLSLATQRLTGELDDGFRAVYNAGDELQRRTVDATLDVATLEAFTPGWIDAAVRSATDQCADALRVFGSLRGLQLACHELANKLDVLDLVRHSRRFVGSDVAAESDVPRLVGVAYALPPFLRIWAIEGLGHDYADWARAHGTGVRLLTADGALPEGALTMLHAGLGLSVADQRLHALTPFDPDCAFHAAVQDFRAICDRHARQGYAGAAYESLGLVTRTLHLPLMDRMDRALAAAEPGLRPYFWHGAGRALYFSPLQFIPGVSSPWARIESEPPDEPARLNATAGLAWATVLVNMRGPEIVAGLLPYISAILPRDDAFRAGAVTAMAMAVDTDASNPFPGRFCAYTPADPVARRLWDASIPSLTVVHDVHRAAKPRGLEQLFRYQPVEHLPIGGGDV
jgi:hypothetical protein